MLTRASLAGVLTPPSTVQLFLTVNVNGSDYKLPFVRSVIHNAVYDVTKNTWLHLSSRPLLPKR
jgi:hypothetical protein